MIALAWGTLRLNFMRWSVNAPEEKKWGFGQFLAVILSTFPCGRFILNFKVFFTLIHPVTFHLYYILEIEYQSIPIGPIPTSSISTGSSPTSQGPLGQLRLHQTAWFPKLVILMFAVVLGIAASVLYYLPNDMDVLADKTSLKWLIQVYCIFHSCVGGLHLDMPCISFECIETAVMA